VETTSGAVNPFEARGLPRFHAPGNGQRVHFYGLVFDDGRKRYVERLQVREVVGLPHGSRLLDDVETGATFKTWKEAIRVNGERNARIGAGLKGERP
jgi:hypothetical protein